MKHQLKILGLCVALQGAALLAPTALTPRAVTAAIAATNTPQTVHFKAVRGEGLTKIAARQDAFRNSISQAVGVFVRSDTLVKDYVTQSDKIRTSSQGFIKHFKLLEENTTADGVIEAVYEITVSTAPLKADLKSVVGTEFSNVGHPTVAVVGWTESKTPLDNAVGQTAVAALNRALINRGYKVVDASEIRNLRSKEPTLQLSGNTTRDKFNGYARQIAQHLKADIYVTTMGSVSDQKASVATRMYNSYTGQVFGAETAYGTPQDDSVSSARKAIDEAVSKSMQTILNQVSNHWQDVLQNGQEYVVVFDGYRSGKQRRTFKRLLSQVSNVINVKQISASGGRAEFSLRGNGSPGDLFDEIIDLAEEAGMKFMNDEAVIRGGRAVFVLR